MDPKLFGFYRYQRRLKWSAHLCQKRTAVHNIHTSEAWNLSQTYTPVLATKGGWRVVNVFNDTGEMVETNPATWTWTTLQKKLWPSRRKNSFQCLQDWSNIKSEVSEAPARSCVRRVNNRLRFSSLALHYHCAAIPYGISLRFPDANS